MYSAPSKPTIVMSSARRSPVYPVTHTFKSRISGRPSSEGRGRNSTLSSTGTSSFAFRHSWIQNQDTTREPARPAALCSASSSDPAGPVLERTTCVTRASWWGVTTAPARCIALTYSWTSAASLPATGAWWNVRPAMNGSHGSSACRDGADIGMDMRASPSKSQMARSAREDCWHPKARVSTRRERSRGGRETRGRREG